MAFSFYFAFITGIIKAIFTGNKIGLRFLSMAHYMPIKKQRRFKITQMTDIDFIRLSALVFATRLVGKTADPISEGTEMAERLFNKLKEKED